MKEVLDFALSLQRATKAFLLYGTPNHPRARETTESLIDHTEALLRHDRVQIVASRGSLFVHGQLVGVHSPAIDWLIAELTDRRLNGFVINKGVTASELSQVVRIFTLKPPQLEQLGGPEKLLADVAATHVRISQARYEEVRDGEIVIPAAEHARDGKGGVALYDPTAAIEKLTKGETLEDAEAERVSALIGQWIRERTKADDSHPASPSGSAPDATPKGPANIAEILRSIAQAESSEGARLQRRLQDLGISRGELDEVLEVIAWENLDVEERVRRSTESNLMFEVPLERAVSFAFELVRSGRYEDASRVVDRVGSGLFSPNAAHRKSAADILQRVVGWIVDPGLPRVIEATIEKLLLTHFVKESDPQIQRRSQIAFMRLYDTWILRGQLDKALQTLRRLESVAAASAGENPWKRDLFEELLDRLVNEERMAQLLEILYAQDLEMVARDVHPLLAHFGGRGAVRLLEALEVEQDRSRRGRLIKAIKAIGKPALHHLESALGSPTWYLVRNALNVLGDVTAIDLIEPMARCLAHEDERVRRAAARALGKLGGVRVERFLVDALKENNGETQIEILGALGTLKAESAIEPIFELVKPRKLGRADDPVRLKAIEILGTIGSPRVVPHLAELVKRRGVLGGQEPSAVRKAICLALIAIGSLDAYKEVQLVAESDPDADLRAELSKALWH